MVRRPVGIRREEIKPLTTELDFLEDYLKMDLKKRMCFLGLKMTRIPGLKGVCGVRSPVMSWVPECF